MPRAVTHARREPPREGVALASLVAFSLVAHVAGLLTGPAVLPPGFQLLPLLLGGLVLGRSAMRKLSCVVAAFLIWDVIALGWDVVRPGALVVVIVTGVVAYEFSRSREETGLGGLRGDTVLIELRRRLELPGELPALAPPWSAESVLRPAGGGPFAGDFIVSACPDGGRSLELALVDVSGKGVEAGSRALLLSGALGGLLGAMGREEVLPAANDYL